MLRNFYLKSLQTVNPINPEPDSISFYVLIPFSYNTQYNWHHFWLANYFPVTIINIYQSLMV